MSTRNRAYCTQCKEIIESKNDSDAVTCKCESIKVWGGDKMYCAATDWGVFKRVSDSGDMIVPIIQEKKKPSFEELLAVLDGMVDKIEALPPQGMNVAINHYDFWSLLMLVSALFRSKQS